MFNKMEANKENCKRKINTTRIPLPLQPLPQVPNYLINSKDCVTTIVRKRAPLKDLKQSVNLAPGTSKQIQGSQNAENLRVTDTDRELKKVKPRNLLLLETRHVTLRRRSEELDYSYRVFADENNSCISISDDERSSVANVLTPICQLKNNRVKKLKRNLKRPHSKELQGLNETSERKKKDELAKSFTSGSKFIRQKEVSIILTQDYVEDIFSYLLAVESKGTRPAPRVSCATRACVINWLIKVNASVVDGYPAVIQAACWYFDSVVTVYRVALHNLQLVAAACYWIALKLHGQAMKCEQLARFAGNAFTAKKLSNAEESVIQKLKFPPSPVVPHEFISYLAWWCDPNSCGEIEAAATFICLAGLMVNKKLCAELPSIFAAACIKNALVLLKKTELLHRFSLCFLYKYIEEKTLDFNYLDPMLRTAIRIISHPSYEYNALVKFYESPPFPVATQIIEGAHKMVHIDAGYSRTCC